MGGAADGFDLEPEGVGVAVSGLGGGGGRVEGLGVELLGVGLWVGGEEAVEEGELDVGDCGVDGDDGNTAATVAEQSGGEAEARYEVAGPGARQDNHVRLRVVVNRTCHCGGAEPPNLVFAQSPQ